MTRMDRTTRSPEALVEEYLDGTLDADGAHVLVEALERGGEAASGVRAHLALAGLLGQALDPVDAEGVARSVGERIAAEGSATAFVRAMDRRLDGQPPPRRHRRAPARPSLVPWLVAAACLLLALGVAWLASPAESARGPCRLAASAPGTRVERDGTCQAAAAGYLLRAGDTLVGGPFAIVYDDGTSLALAAGSRLQLAVSDAGKRLALDAGSGEAEVAHQPDGRPLILSTPVAQVVVVGTRFRLAADAVRTRIDLVDGTLEVLRLSDRRQLLLQAGQTATVAEGEDFAARTSTPPPSPPPAPAPASARQRLFPSSSLSGWTQQHGEWRQDGEVVRGRASGGGTARLLSVQAYLDLDLACQLRIEGCDKAEIQVGDYNWFFTIPAGRGEWTTVHLLQQGARLSCTADGRPLAVEAGDGAAPRPGPLSFYVRSGVLELRQATLSTVPVPLPVPHP